MGCGGGSTSTTVNNIPAWVEAAGKDAYGKANTFFGSGYTPYPGMPSSRVEGFSPGQQATFGQIRGYTPPNVTNQAMGLVSQGTAPIAGERTVDQGGRLGATSDYVNPYLEGALRPAIDEVWRGYDKAKLGINSAATSAHAFGDARHGIVESDLNRSTLKNIGDMTGGFYKTAFDTAMGQRGQDLDRMIGAETGNRNAAMTGAQLLPNIATSDQNNFLARMQQLLGVGQLEQQQGQNVRDADYGAYQAWQQDQYDRLAALVSVLGQVPYSRNQTTSTTSSPGIGGIASAAGALLGAFIP